MPDEFPEMDVPRANRDFDLAQEGLHIIRTDPHSHILPGIDDGSDSIDTSVRMAENAVRLGIENLVATPHGLHSAFADEVTAGRVRELVGQLNDELADLEIPLTVYPGMEIYMSERIPVAFEAGELLTWADQKKYVLIELGFRGRAAFESEILEFLESRGLTPIIAHPERYRWIYAQPKTIDQWNEREYYFQINVMSINGQWGSDAQKFAMDVMKKTDRWIIGTDSHSDAPRFWDITGARVVMQKEGILDANGQRRVVQAG